MDLFGEQRREAWHQFCDSHNGHYEDGGFWRPDSVMVRTDVWLVTTDMIGPGGSHGPMITRMRARYRERARFRFRLSGSNIIGEIGKLLGMEDIEIGDADFDRTFIVRSNSPELILKLFSDRKIKWPLIEERALRFGIEARDTIFSPVESDGVVELRLEIGEVVKDPYRLNAMLNIMSAALNQLCEIGVAQRVDPDAPVLIQPGDTLLRASSAPSEETDTLLRPSREKLVQHADELPRVDDTRH